MFLFIWVWGVADLQGCLGLNSLPRGHKVAGPVATRPHLLRSTLGRGQVHPEQSRLWPDVCLPVLISPKHMRFGNTEYFIRLDSDCISGQGIIPGFTEKPALRCLHCPAPSCLQEISRALKIRKGKHNKPGLCSVHQGANISQTRSGGPLC